MSRVISLQHLNIGGAYIIDENLFFAIANSCPHLKVNFLINCTLNSIHYSSKLIITGGIVVRAGTRRPSMDDLGLGLAWMARCNMHVCSVVIRLICDFSMGDLKCFGFGLGE